MQAPEKDGKGGDQPVQPLRPTKRVRFPVNRTRSSSRVGSNKSLLQAEEEQQAVDEKVAAARVPQAAGTTNMSASASTTPTRNPKDPRYNQRRWENLVSKQEEMIQTSRQSLIDQQQHAGDSKPRVKKGIPKRSTSTSSTGSAKRRVSSTTTRPKRTKSFDDSNGMVISGDDAASDAGTLGSPVPMPLPLVPNTNIRPRGEDVLPGAFRMRPTMGATPAQGLAEGERNDHRDRAPSRQSVVANNEQEKSAREILLEATLVASDRELPSNARLRQLLSPSQQQLHQSLQQSIPPSVVPEPELVMGHPMDPAQMRKLEGDHHSKHRQHDKLRCMILALIGCFLVFLVVLGIILGVTIVTRQKDQAQQSTPIATPVDHGPASSNEALPTDQDIIEEPPTTTTMGPMVTTTTTASSSSESPTMAPTMFGLEVLPLFTQQTIARDRNSDSPQALALKWVQQDLEQLKDDTDDMTTEAYFPLQRFVLATLYYALDGPQWNERDDWLVEGTDPCDWHTQFYGSICAAGGNRRERQRRNLRTLQQQEERREQEGTTRYYYQRLSLNGNNLVGTLPPEIGLLSRLDVVRLDENRIAGSIPSEAGLWKDLTFFQIAGNELSGPLPSELGALDEVWHMSFSFNRLTGTIPTQLSQLSDNLEALGLSNNLLSGPVVPSEFGSLTALEQLYLYANPNLTGPLPTQLGLMRKLKRLVVNDIPLLDGTLPSEIGLLAGTLEEIHLQHTAVDGTVPTSWGSLTKLTKLALHNTNLSGTLPVEVCGLMNTGRLQDLSVDCVKLRCNDCDCDCSQTIHTESKEEVVLSAPGALGMGPQDFAAAITTDPPPTEETPPKELVVDTPGRLNGEVP